MTYLSQRSLGAAPDMEPALLERMKANILTRVKEGDLGEAVDRYNTLSPDDKYAVLMYLRTARDRGEITNEALETVAEGRPFLAMSPLAIKSWFTRNKFLVLGGTALAIGALWYFGKEKKRKT